MKKNISLVIVLFLTISFAFSQNTSEFFSKSDAFFKANVKNGKVAYKAIKDNPAALNELLEMAKVISVSKDNAAEYQSFWINGYNLLVIDEIVKNYPIKSPIDKPGFFDGNKNEIGGTKITLNDIENKLLRKVFPKEPRFHFVLVCGGLGCPPIIGEAYTPSKLETQLETQTKLAINDSNFIRVKKNKVQVSQIFEWYPGDFKQDGMKLVDFINKYKSEKLPEKAKVSYYLYDWTLNEAQ
ncbi:DUF547 domain-containing protein [Maribacter sp. 2308TA10-17]|uniref:DUF547 domain-containing protein n=1 Tax=Maribacter sp. 2308TA10-17 TaxID=3386276 RepID=UPI0039BD3B71